MNKEEKGERTIDSHQGSRLNLQEIDEDERRKWLKGSTRERRGSTGEQRESISTKRTLAGEQSGEILSRRSRVALNWGYIYIPFRSRCANKATGRGKLPKPPRKSTPSPLAFSPLEVHRLNRLIPLQLHHQIIEPAIRLHQLRGRTHEPIRQLPHTPEKPILKHPLLLIHEIRHRNREPIHARLIPRNGRDFRHDEGFLVVGVHGLEVRDAGGGGGAVVMEADEVGRVGRDEGHELLEPALTILVIRHGRTDEFLAVVLTQGDHLVVPGLCGALRGDVVFIRLVEEVDDGFLAGEDVLPVLAGELGFEVDHWAEGGAVVQFGGDPGVPVADGGEGAVEVGLVHGPGDARVTGAGAVGPVPEQAALFDYHG